MLQKLLSHLIISLTTRIVVFISVNVAASFGKSSKSIPPDEFHG